MLKIRKGLGWNPKFKLQEALNQTVDWYLNNRQWWEEIANDEILDPTPWKQYRTN